MISASLQSQNFMTVREFAKVYSLSPSYVYEKIRIGEIPTVSLPGNVKRIDLLKFNRMTIEQDNYAKDRSLEIKLKHSAPSHHKKGDLTWLEKD